jgi:hypothetical protein
MMRMTLMPQVMAVLVIVGFAAGPAFGQAQAPVTKAPPAPRTPSAITGPPTGLPRVGPPASDRRTTILPGPMTTIDPRTGQPITTAPPDPTTPSVLDGSGKPVTR